MKTKFWKAAAAVLMGAAFLATSCVEKEDIEPSFPAEAENLTGTPGQALEITINPNMAWELELSEANTTFWFEGEDDVKLTNISGVSGEQTVTIHITEEQPLGAGYNCEVTLKMGGESKVIATIMVAGATPSLLVYPAVWDAENSAWTNGIDGYVYATEAVEAVEFKFDTNEKTFCCPVKVVSNYKWSVPTSADYAWITPVPEQNLGTVNVKLEAKTDSYPAGGVTNAVINILRSGSDSAAPETTLSASIGDYKEIFVTTRIESGETINFEKEGNEAGFEEVNPYLVYTSDDTEYKVLTYKDGVYSPMPAMSSWVFVDSFTEEATGLLRYHEIKFMVKANTEESARKAVVVVITGDKADQNYLTNNDTEIAEGFNYFIIEQEGTVATLEGPLANVFGGVEHLTSQKMGLEQLTATDAPWLFQEPFAGNQYAYRLTSANEQGLAAFKNIPETYTYEIWSFDGVNTTHQITENWWVTAMAPDAEDGNPLLITLNPYTAYTNWWAEGDDELPIPFEENCSELTGIDMNTMSLRVVYENVYVVIKDGENIIAVVECKFDTAAKFGNSEQFSFMINDLGATLEKKSLTDLPGETGMMIQSDTGGMVTEGYLLTSSSAGEIVIYTPSYSFYQMDTQAEWYTANQTGMDQMTIVFNEGSGTDVIIFTDTTGMHIAALVIQK